MANLVGGGVDKLSFDERVGFIDGQMENIMDSAANPLKGSRWWLEAEDPFQCLAACMEISAALKSGDPESFVSHLPVHQDGSCNGLQHYAALGRDVEGAHQVNMTSIPRPADVYTGIAQRVKEIVTSDAEDKKIPQAMLIAEHVDRKMVKQTVMTSVYGVTFVGAREQLYNRIKEREIIADESVMYGTSKYAAKVTLAALSEMFFSARNIMAWLAECAQIISSANKPVEWTMPMGLPVIQPYRRVATRMVKTSLQSFSIFDEKPLKVIPMRQKAAFPPNFIHSLDSSHMMKTAIACYHEKMSFAGVHDSYWTHACDVERMNEILRREFVDLHSQPILEDLLAAFKKKFPANDFPDVPERGTFDLLQVLEAPYFFD
eukprot:TRINITY_DN15948_c0_g2_i2.p1 TRINITY_DN15948_c0_g2~~TRINITY_DN15948_c0_g2_i2.p1  ORF type:complete len:413 (-),score=97.33 TRINITY_DN15948_c0_g2_i2:89-1213(-)